MANFDDTFNFDNHGPYPDEWSDAAKRFWDSEPITYRELYDSDDEWEFLQHSFDVGWIAAASVQAERGEAPYTKDEHEQARQDFYQISGTQESSFDWDGYREYLHSIGS